MIHMSLISCTAVLLLSFDLLNEVPVAIKWCILWLQMFFNTSLYVKSSAYVV